MRDDYEAEEIDLDVEDDPPGPPPLPWERAPAEPEMSIDRAAVGLSAAVIGMVVSGLALVALPLGVVAVGILWVWEPGPALSVFGWIAFGAICLNLPVVLIHNFMQWDAMASVGRIVTDPVIRRGIHRQTDYYLARSVVLNGAKVAAAVTIYFQLTG